MTGNLPSSAQTIATGNNRMPNGKPTIAFIGFGEAGHAIASGLREGGLENMVAWDILFPKAEGTKLRAAADAVGVRVGQSAAEAVREAELVFSAVTAASSAEAAASVKAHLRG
jgi:3-hydroxyisobutyrate dehydrogenase-like beta-hydroxyacid dehydrogenase